ncbi:MAG: hypothetical protein IJZ16_06980 [Clostridia bacterium]|nr:hypothetical protein [Clostridia bacterium]
MKKIKMVISILISIVILFSSTIISNANTVDENRKAFDEFYEIVTEAFAAEGKELIIDYDENHKYTQQDIDSMLYFLENNEIVVSTTDNVPINNKNSARLMPVDYNCSSYITFYSSMALCEATFELIVKGTIDVQSNNIMSVTTRQIVYRYGVNYSSNTLTTTYTKSGNNLTVYIEGDILFSYTEPTTGLNFSVNDRAEYSKTFDVLQYI